MAVELNNLNLKGFGKSLKRSLGLLWSTSKRLAILSLLFLFIQAVIPVGSLYLIKLLIEKVTDKAAFADVLPIIIYFLGAQLLLAMANQYSSYLTNIYQLKLTDFLSQKVLNQAVKVDYRYYENPNYHDSLHLAQHQSLFKANILITSFSSFITSGFSLLLLLAFFISLKSFFAVIFLLFSIPLAVIKWYFGVATMQQERKLVPLERESNYLHYVLTTVSYAKDTRVFGFGSYFIEKFKAIRTNILQQKQKLTNRLTKYSLVAESVEIIAMAVIFGTLAKQSLTGSISLGVFVIYIQGFQSLQTNSKNFLQAVVQILQQRIFLKDLFSFLDIKNDIPANTLEKFPQPISTLSVKNINFRYHPGGKQVLHNISINCEPGKIIAIVGENGSGKSTLMKVLAKLYEPESGSITFNNTELSEINTQDYREQSVFLFQDFEKYFFTIEENIVLGMQDKAKTIDNIKAAAELSGASKFIAKLSNSYQTRMGAIFEGSEQLSGGQWQKLALARVFYRDDVSLIVLDEPTSALDVQAEFEIFNQIKNLAHNKMVILITHRLYNLKIADYLYVIDEGRIAEEGTFNELIAKKGQFTELYNMQQL